MYSPRYESNGESANRLGLLIDPANQAPEVAQERVRGYLLNGGTNVLVGGSGHIPDQQFQDTVRSVSKVINPNARESIYIFPGSYNQVPESGYGIRGVFYYTDILCSPNSDREFHDFTTRSELIRWREVIEGRGIRALETLYVLSGPNTSAVARETGMAPIDLSREVEVEVTLARIARRLELQPDMLFIEGGSGSDEPVSRTFLGQVRSLVDEISPLTTLVTGGGISTSGRLKDIKDFPDLIVVGNYFEQNPISDFSKFVDAIQN